MKLEIGKIKPSPFQPRLEFDLEDLKGSIIKDGILVPLTVRRVNENQFELIDGERRLRLAKELGYQTVSCEVIDVDDETADRMVWKVNTLRKDYRPKEKALHYKKHQDVGWSLRQIAREHSDYPNNVLAYLNVFKLSREYQELVWEGPLSVGHVQVLESDFSNGVSILTIESKLRIAEERGLSVAKFRDMEKPSKARSYERRVEAAQEEAEKIIPEPQIKIETPDDYEKAAKALKKEAKKRREAEVTPEQKTEIEAKKQREKEEKERKQREKETKEKAHIQKEAEKIAKGELIKDKKFREEVRGDSSRPEMEALGQVEQDNSLTKEDKENIRQGVADGRIRGEKQIKEEVEWIKIQKVDEAKKEKGREKSRELESFLKRVQKVSIELRNKLNTLRRQFQIYPETVKYLPQPQASRTAEALNLLILVMTELQKTLEGQKWQKSKETEKLSQGQ